MQTQLSRRTAPIENWDPFRELNEVQNQVSSLLSRRFGNGWSTEPTIQPDWAPAVDITEDENSFQIQADLPDVKKEDVEVSVEKGILTISGERKQEKEEKKQKYHRMERTWGRYERSFQLPDGVNADKVDAQFKNGVLTLRVPKTKQYKEEHRKIEIHD